MMNPEHANPLGNVHGGWILKLIDEAGGIVASRHARAPAVTVEIDSVSFCQPVHVGNLVHVRAADYPLVAHLDGDRGGGGGGEPAHGRAAGVTLGGRTWCMSRWILQGAQRLCLPCYPRPRRSASSGSRQNSAAPNASPAAEEARQQLASRV
ncbi:MAG: hypothetical protein KatS3mg021_2458 [Fimbriimonadales bacterium]|nr:MAG: hypothetical protein KatS3mg021_2458 [Fimbriimonadales bacterium]